MGYAVLIYIQINWNACTGQYLKTYQFYDPNTTGQTVFEHNSAKQKIQRAKGVYRNFPEFEYLKHTSYQPLSWHEKLQYQNGADIYELMKKSKHFGGGGQTKNDAISIDDDDDDEEEEENDKDKYAQKKQQQDRKWKKIRMKIR